MRPSPRVVDEWAHTAPDYTWRRLSESRDGATWQKGGLRLRVWLTLDGNGVHWAHYTLSRKAKRPALDEVIGTLRAFALRPEHMSAARIRLISDGDNAVEVDVCIDLDPARLDDTREQPKVSCHG